MLSAGLVDLFKPTDKSDIQKPTCAEGEQLQTVTNILGQITGYKCAPKPQTSGGPTWDEASKSWKCPTGFWYQAGKKCKLPDGRLAPINPDDHGSCFPYGMSVSAVMPSQPCSAAVMAREGFPAPTPTSKRAWPKGTRYFFDSRIGAYRVFVPRGQICPPGNVPTFAPCFTARRAASTSAAPTASNGVAVTQSDQATIAQKGCPTGQMMVLVSRTAGFQCVPQYIQGALGWAFGQEGGLVEVEPEKSPPTGEDVLPAPQTQLEPPPIGPMPGEPGGEPIPGVPGGGQVVPGAGVVDSHGCVSMVQKWCPDAGKCITPAAGEKCEPPAYKKWWFWTIVGGGALVLGTSGYFLLRPRRRVTASS